GTQTRRNPALKGENAVQIHPDTAHAHGLRAGQSVTLVTAHGQATLPVTLTPGIRPDTLFVPFHWPGAANLLTDPTALDPHSRMPGFKITPVTLRPAPAPALHPAQTVPPPTPLIPTP
ncbi:molybdopterin dinucleotide binding domain-containing protein, partial [Deinococcus sp. 23YEL01]|uniref:molybdopterin dinucleotide binding domain-containing protein n=1 Tax=Deinococcus sp. 23YEL01 TaxID=2745871 RepID=UPI0027152C71